MKVSLDKFSGSRLARGGALLVLAAVILASVAGANKPRYKLGGTWVGELDGVQWVSIHSPLDANGKTAAAKLQWLALSAPFQQLSGALGVDRLSDAVGSFEMTGKDTAKYTLTWYGIASGTPSATDPVGDQVKAINVMVGTWHYTGPDTAESSETYTVYLTAGNPSPQPTLFAAEGATVAYTQTFDWHPQYRVTVP